MKYALITGPTSGIGYYLAHEFAKQKIPLVLVARDELKLKSVADEFRGDYGLDVHEIITDLSHISAAQFVHAEVEKLSIEIGYLVNNAGIGDFAYFKDADEHKIAGMMNLNMHTVTMLTKIFIPQLISNQGKILNVASTAAFQPGPTMAVYYATKSYVLSFSEALAEELKTFGVTVTALCPGATQSEFQKAAHMEDSALVKNKKLPSAEEVARFGFKAMMQGRRIAVHGLTNKLFAFLVRFLPRTFVTILVHKIQGKPDFQV